MHINYGANINITTQPNCQNNFIFNNTAPINFNVFSKNNGSQNGEIHKNSQKPDLKNSSTDANETNNYDQDIIHLILKYGYTEKEVIFGLRDTNSHISKVY